MDFSEWYKQYWKENPGTTTYMLQLDAYIAGKEAVISKQKSIAMYFICEHGLQFGDCKVCGENNV